MQNHDLYKSGLVIPFISNNPSKASRAKQSQGLERLLRSARNDNKRGSKAGFGISN